MTIVIVDEALIPGSASSPTEPAVVLHAVGDLHMGAWLQARRDMAMTDFLALNPTVTQRVFVGDLSHDGQPANKTAAKAWMDSAGTGWLAIPGNHDYDQSQNATHFLTDYGMTVPWSVDVPDSNVRLIGLGPTSNSTQVTFSSTQLDFLDAQLDTTRDAIIFGHAPLDGSVSGATGAMEAEPIATIAGILNTHPSAKAWLSGHTHSTLGSTNLINTSYSVGSRTILTVNCSSMARVGHTTDSESMTLASPLLTIYDDRIEVSFRNHKTASAIEIAGSLVHTMNFS